MPAERSLRRRLTAAFVMLAVVIGGIFAIAGYFMIEAVEDELLQSRLSRAGEQFIKNDQRGLPRPEFAELRFAIDDEIPAEYRALAPGLHEIDTGDRFLQVMILKHEGRDYAVIDDVSEFERLEHFSFAILGLAFFGGVLFAFGVARASADRVIAPLTTLAGAVQRDDLAAHPQLLEAEDEVGTLARAFDSAASKLREFLERERLFTSDVSHELRTPLTIVLGAAELLGARLADRPELLAVTDRIRRASNDATLKVSALLQLARARSSTEREALELRALVTQEIERCRPLLADKPVTIELDAPAQVWVSAPRDLAAIAIGNLLRNACQFTERGSVRAMLRADALVVEDTGPGVPQPIRARLFEPFVRGDDSSGGTGLGLSIVQRVAEHAGWTIRLDDTHGGGSRFTLAFGARPSHAEEISASPAETRESTGSAGTRAPESAHSPLLRARP